ncbi:M15 family metallopeptidase [Priestia filamentosa]|uniref:peptidoglycan-binding protein n=1 Tax=Priestia filamentosa TaxID=1402861 RepID=UPI0039832801
MAKTTLKYLKERSEKKVVGLHQTIASKALQLVEMAYNKGYYIAITQGLRTFPEQDALYAQGRTKPGKVVTNAKGGQSIHNYGFAFDFAVFDENQNPVWTGNTYNKVGALGKQLGLEWGGDWKNFKDLPHFEYTFALTLKQLQAGKRPPGSAVIGTVPNSNNYLDKGDQGTLVKGLQGKLQALEFNIGSTGIDGFFGAATEKAVKEFQKKHGLKVDGIVGTATQSKIDAEYKKLSEKPTDKTKWRLVTGTFQNAEQLANAIKRLKKDHGWLTYEKAESLDPNPTYRIMTGFFIGKDVAEKAAAELRKDYGWTVYVKEA